MNTNYSNFSKQDDKVIEDDETRMGYVNCDKLYVRTDPSSDSEPLTIIKKNDEVLISSGVNNDSDWYGVCTASGQDGFVMKKFIVLE